jgi:hypothetical protein
VKVEPLKEVRFKEREETFLDKLKRALPNVISLDEFRGRRGRRGARGLQGDAGEVGPQGEPGERGPQGEVGSRGLPGRDGEQGERGLRGYKGVQGRAGEDGRAGAVGPKGDKGDVGPVPRHKWEGTRLSFELPNGKFGRSVNLQGPGGGRGAAGKGASQSYQAMTLAGNVLTLEKQGALGPDLSVDLTPIATGEELLAQRFDEENGGDIIYVGEATPGAAPSAAVWRIKRVTFTEDGDGDTDGVTEWADGDATQNNIWDNRLALSYS